MSVAVMEALGAGCGVVASRVSGVEDYERHPLAEGSLWVYPVGDVRAAADAIAEAATLPASERGARALALHEAEFSLPRCVARYADLVASAPPAHEGGEWPSGLQDRLVGLASHAVAAQRRARIWLRHRYGRTNRAPRGESPARSTREAR
jgi:hypothetical protein